MNVITPIAKTLFTGKTHSKAGRDGFARSSDGFVDLSHEFRHITRHSLLRMERLPPRLRVTGLSRRDRPVLPVRSQRADCSITSSIASGIPFLQPQRLRHQRLRGVEAPLQRLA